MVNDCVDRELSRVFKNVSWWGWMMGVRWIWEMKWSVGLSRKNVVIYYDVVVILGFLGDDDAGMVVGIAGDRGVTE